MNLLQRLNLTAEELLEKIQIDVLTSGELLNDPQALKEPLEYNLATFNLTEQDIGLLKLKGSLSSVHTSQLFNNAADDKDNDEILSQQSAGPFLILNPALPVLKHKFSFNVNVGAKGSVKGFSFGLDSGVAVNTIAYRTHQPNEATGQALIQDFLSMPFIFVLQDVKALNQGEALALVAGATLGLDLEFKANEVFSAGISALSEYLPEGKGVAVNCEIGAKLNVGLSISDSFRLIFSKIGNNRYKLQIVKELSRTASAGASIGVTASFSDPQVVSEFINGQMDRLLEAITTLDADQLSTIEDKLREISQGTLTIDQLSETEQELLNLLIERLIKTSTGQDVAKVLEKLADIRQNVKDKITEAAKKKIEAAFSYSYERIDKSKELLTAEISENVLDSTHHELLLFNLNTILSIARDPGTTPADLHVLDYLNEESIKDTENWGITIGIGKSKVGFKETKELEKVINRNLQGDQKIAYEGFHRYDETGNLGGYSEKWWGGFNVAMKQFSRSPTADEFDYGFTFLYERFERRLARGDRELLLQLMDHGVVWNMMSVADFQQQCDNCWAALSGSTRDITFSYKLDFSSTAFQKLLLNWDFLMKHRPEVNLEMLAAAFGKAMPYMENYIHRSNIGMRQRSYGELWKYYLTQEGFNRPADGNDYSYYVANAANYFRRIESPLAEREGAYASGQLGDTFLYGGLIRMNGPGKLVKNFNDGLAGLLAAIVAKSSRYDTDIKNSFKLMHPAWSQSFVVKALGIYLVEMAKRAGIERDIQSKLEISYTDGGGTQKQMIIQIP